MKLTHTLIFEYTYMQILFPYEDVHGSNSFSMSRLQKGRVSHTVCCVMFRNFNIHKIWMLPGEDPGDFNRRRHQAVTRICRRDGLWGDRVNRRFLSWVHHAARSSAQPNRSWFPSLLTWHDDTWLTAQRMAFAGLDAGSTGTRVQQGRPSTRLAQA